MFIMLFIFKDLTIIGEILTQFIEKMAVYIPTMLCLTDINTCTVTELYWSVWGTIGIKILWVHRFCKFGLGIWPFSFSAHEQWNWKESKGQTDLYVTQEEKMEALNFFYVNMPISSAYFSIPHCFCCCCYLLLFQVREIP